MAWEEVPTTTTVQKQADVALLRSFMMPMAKDKVPDKMEGQPQAGKVGLSTRLMTSW